jgi:hypothetical protein
MYLISHIEQVVPVMGYPNNQANQVPNSMEVKVEQIKAEQAKVEAAQVEVEAEQVEVEQVDQLLNMGFQDMGTIPVFLPQEDQVETIDFIQLYSLHF